MIRDTLENLLKQRNLTREEASALMNAIVSGELDDAQIAAVIVALRAKGETVDEIAGFVSSLRDKVIRVSAAREGLVDTCGTGGDGAHQRGAVEQLPVRHRCKARQVLEILLLTGAVRGLLICPLGPWSFVPCRPSRRCRDRPRA